MSTNVFNFFWVNFIFFKPVGFSVVPPCEKNKPSLSTRISTNTAKHSVEDTQQQQINEFLFITLIPCQYSTSVLILDDTYLTRFHFSWYLSPVLFVTSPIPSSCCFVPHMSTIVILCKLPIYVILANLKTITVFPYNLLFLLHSVIWITRWSRLPEQKWTVCFTF